LAQAPATVDQAVVLLPELVKMGRGDFAVYDTAAMVYLRAGDLRAAEENMKKALRLVKKGDYAWVEVYLNATETQMKSGQLKEAREYLNMVKKTPGRPAALDARVRDLDGELTRREREQPGWF
jgi:Tfp pilus assembly protein PilF